MLPKKEVKNVLPDQPFKRHGDKQNSVYFEEYLLKIYKQRDEMKLTENVRKIEAVVVEVDEGSADNYLAELSLMTLYSYQFSWVFEGYRWHLMRIDMQSPDLLVRELIDEKVVKFDFAKAQGVFGTDLNKYVRTRYVGEIYAVADMSLLKSQFDYLKVDMMNVLENKDNKIFWTRPSVYTWNQLGYVKESTKREYAASEVWKFSDIALELFAKMKALQKSLEITDYILPFDHLATRVFSHDCEHALLEYLSLTSYYFWGAFDITEQNSSTNVTRSAHDYPEALSPAKVFTANNTPFYVEHINKLPSPTEDFVRRHGRRMHHLAVAVKDGFIGPEENDIKNVDFVVAQLKKAEKEFLSHVVGSCDEGLKQIFSRASEHSGLITEYIQRCYDYDGFFTKHNVAALTMAAGKDDHRKN